MATSFISAAQKLSYEGAFDSLHESFGRDVVIIKEAKRIVIDENNENYNYFYPESSQGNDTEEFTPVSGVFKMRIMWEDPTKQNWDVTELRPKIHANLCRLKMKQDAFDFIQGYKQFIIDGRPCEWAGFSRPHGIISPNFYTIIAKENS